MRSERRQTPSRVALDGNGDLIPHGAANIFHHLHAPLELIVGKRMSLHAGRSLLPEQGTLPR